MVEDGMDKTKKIDQAAREFFKAVVDGMNHRPQEFVTDVAMARAAGVPTATFNEYKTGAKGTGRPNFFTVYKIAHVLCNGPPCSLESKNLMFNRFQKALKKDNSKILDKIVSLILADSDMEAFAASIEVHYRRLFPPETINENP
jgi:hypothetical protein